MILKAEDGRRKEDGITTRNLATPTPEGGEKQKAKERNAKKQKAKRAKIKKQKRTKQKSKKRPGLFRFKPNRMGDSELSHSRPKRMGRLTFCKFLNKARGPDAIQAKTHGAFEKNCWAPRGDAKIKKT